MKQKKILLCLAATALLLGLGACGSSGSQPGGDETTTSDVVEQYFNVVFMNGEERFATVRVKDGETVPTDKVGTPAQTGYTFVGWFTNLEDETTEFKLGETVVTAATTVYAKFEKADVEDETKLEVHDKKDAEKSYYLIVGWYDKEATSGLNTALMQHFYCNLRTFLRAYGASEEQLNLVSVRGYDGSVTEMSGAIEDDGDVDLVIGLGGKTGSLTILAPAANNTLSGVSMGGKSRAIAVRQDNKVAIAIFDWLKENVNGKAQSAFDPAIYLKAADIVVPEERTEPVPEDLARDENGYIANPVSSNALTIAYYNKYVSDAIQEQFETAFTGWLETNSFNVNVNYVPLGNDSTDVAGVTTLVNDYNGEHSDAIIDAILGGKNLSSKIVGYFNFSAEPQTIGNNDDRLMVYHWQSQNTENVNRLWQFMNTEEGKKSLATPADAPKDLERDENGYIANPVTSNTLTVGYYAKFVDAAIQGNFETAFKKWLSDNSISNITALTFVPLGNDKTKVDALKTAVSDYNGEHSDATIDIILGGKNLAGNLDVYFNMSAEPQTIGANNDRLMVYNCQSKNTENINRVWQFMNTTEGKASLATPAGE
jgi:uncharacterized repeat protein (TIGR02543 family)